MRRFVSTNSATLIGAHLHAYDLIALDLDGTLFSPDGTVSQANRDAVDRARDAGVEVVICTGRGYPESGAAIRAINADQPAAGHRTAPIVVAGGAMIVDATSGRTLHRWPINYDLSQRLCDLFASMNRAPLLLKDSDAAGFDYLVVQTGPIEEPTSWWFGKMPVEVKFVERLEDDEHPEHTVRVGFAADVQTMNELETAVRAQFEDEVLIHAFPAVTGNASSTGAGVASEDIHLLEVFDARVSKWAAIERLAIERGIPLERTAAIGDQINDLKMIEGSGLGVAMGNAIEEIKRASNVQTESNAEDGVANAIDRILRGAW